MQQSGSVVEAAFENALRLRDVLFHTKRSTVSYGEKIETRLEDVLQRWDCDMGALVLETVLEGG